MHRLPSHLRRAHTSGAHAILQEGSVGWGDRLAALEQSRFPSYTTSVGWLGYSDEKIKALTQRACADGGAR